MTAKESETKSIDEIIQEICNVLSEADGEFIADIANQVLSKRVVYTEDSVFEIVSKE